MSNATKSNGQRAAELREAGKLLGSWMQPERVTDYLALGADVWAIVYNRRTTCVDAVELLSAENAEACRWAYRPVPRIERVEASTLFDLWHRALERVQRRPGRSVGRSLLRVRREAKRRKNLGAWAGNSLGAELTRRAGGAA